MSATEELRRLLDERGVEYETNEDERDPIVEPERTAWEYNQCGHEMYVVATEAVDVEGKPYLDLDFYHYHTPEQAIAATLGIDRHPYEQRITGDGSDWGEIMRDAYDDLIAAACESCTPEQMRKLADHIRAELWSGTRGMATIGTLTAEQVMKTAGRHQPDYCSDTHVCFDWQAIADELNAELGGGTCEYVIEDNMNESEGMGDVWFRCTNCCTCYDYYADDWLLKMPHCPKCGAIVEGVR